ARDLSGTGLPGDPGCRHAVRRLRTVTSERADVVVVGAGPAGSLAARFSALGGARTILLDRRPELGHPVQCGEFVPSARELADIFASPDLFDGTFDLPAEAIQRETRTMACIAPSGRRYEFPLEGVSVARRAFDKALAYRAEGAGAELRNPAGVVRVRDGTVELATGGRIEARVVIGADGPVSVVARSAGVQLPRQMYRMITASAPGAFAPRLDLFFGSVAPGGYAWSIPKLDGANVGLGAFGPSDGRSLDALLDAFVASQGWDGAVDRTRWWVPIGAPPVTAVAGRSLLTGDAANLVMATNGAGIPTAMISGRDAGTIAALHVRDGTPLRAYDPLWKRHLFGPLRRGHRVKRAADPVARSDPLLELGMRYIGATGLDDVMRLRWPARLGGAN
ncbi:MAG: NAD(P)/FAD-dependent oxidoreductase, partial [Thermoplasmata archaeon]|nr:NAD(P)/FAD-dependent oxidoreductase [Thermoplasmata archaeon]